MARPQTAPRSHSYRAIAKCISELFLNDARACRHEAARAAIRHSARRVRRNSRTQCRALLAYSEKLDDGQWVANEDASVEAQMIVESVEAEAGQQKMLLGRTRAQVRRAQAHHLPAPLDDWGHSTRRTYGATHRSRGTRTRCHSTGRRVLPLAVYRCIRRYIDVLSEIAVKQALVSRASTHHRHSCTMRRRDGCGCLGAQRTPERRARGRARAGRNKSDMRQATFIRELEGFTGRANLYRVMPLIKDHLY